MAYPETATVGQTTLAVEFDPDGSPDVFTTICGIVDWNYQLSTQVDEVEVPDCDDPDLALQNEVSVRSIGATANASGIWALSSHSKILDWATSGKKLKVKVSFLRVTSDGATGDIEALTGPAVLANLNLEVARPKVRNAFDLNFDGVPVATLKA